MTESIVKLITSDGELFEVKEDHAFQSEMIKNMVEDTGSNASIPLPNVAGSVLIKIIEYLKFHTDTGNKPTTEAMKSWDAEYVSMPQQELFDLILVSFITNIFTLLSFSIILISSVCVCAGCQLSQHSTPA